MIEINLLQKPSTELGMPTLTPRRVQLITAFSLVSAICLMAFCTYSLKSSLTEEQLHLAALRQELAQIAEAGIELQRTAEYRAQLERRVELIQRLKRNQSSPVLVLNAIIASIPAEPSLWLTQLKHGEFSARIKGRALDVPTITDFIAELSSAGPFVSVDLDYWQEEGRNIKFELNCQLVEEL
jgi:Tfp pilus assembly protein PilN